MQQIIVSGVGGQGVLFITKLLAETALQLGFSVLVSETHGMAQRGGYVVSHLKISRTQVEGAETADGSNSQIIFTSPLIRPGRADILLGLHADSTAAHSFYLKSGGLRFYNSSDSNKQEALDASAIAATLGSPVSANLVLLGFAAGSGALFCTTEELAATLEEYSGKRLETSLKALNIGNAEAEKKSNGQGLHQVAFETGRG